MKYLAYFCVILTGLSFWSRPAHDPDLGFHLAGGAYIEQQLENATNFSIQNFVPQKDFINSFTAEWHDYHWLGQLVFYQIYKLGGYPALHFMLGIIAVLILVVFYQIAQIVTLRRDNDQSALTPLLLILPSAILLYDVSSMRPQMLAILLVALALKRLLQKQNSKELLYLFGLSVIAVNIHVYWILIPFLFFIYRSLSCKLAVDAERQVSFRYAVGGLLLLLSAGLLSPYGIFSASGKYLDNYAILWDYLTQTSGFLKTYISEFKGTIRGLSIISVLLLFYFACLVRFCNKSFIKRYYPEIISSAIFFILTLDKVKYLGVFSVLVIPFFALIYNLKSLELPRHKLFPFVLVPFVLYLGFNVFLSSAKLNNVSSDIAGYLPQEACSSLAKLPLRNKVQGHYRLLTSFNYGNWCRWFVYQENPQLDLQVTTDGRTQRVPDEHFIKTRDLYALKEGWESTLAEWQPDFILGYRSAPLAHVLFEKSDQWLPTHSDNQFAIFIRKNLVKG